jgi:two-component system, OmpR family, response regulator
MRILVVEDEPRMAALLQQGLSEESHVVSVVGDGREAVRLIKSSRFDLIILDIMLPGMDGLNVARRVRAAGNQTPILMLTARDRTKDIVAGLDAGADDYLTKPFPFEELCARVRAVARRGPIPRPVHLQIADLELDPANREVRRGERLVELTRTEFAILELLLRNAGRVVPRDAILEGVWGVGAEVENNTLDAFIRLLRSKLDLPKERPLIHTVRGVGYVIREEQ